MRSRSGKKEVAFSCAAVSLQQTVSASFELTGTVPQKARFPYKSSTRYEGEENAAFIEMSTVGPARTV
jgi:hypothetical protein